ncbi:universal stress protein Sll1388-like isoform X1 [Saccostrea cucullata]|uniref:universal stress protein Sll1388-like isoform X1 n=1 Tax=Saccostrea cuccullata TaxID=36930 RepID=UPI002ED51DC2
MKVLIATDGSEIARRALEWYMQNLHKEDNRLYIVHVTDNRYSFENKDPIIPTDQHFFVLEHQEKETKAKELINKMEAYIQDNRIKGEVNKLFGDVGHEIVKRAKDIDASLIITGSRGLGVVRRTVLGSVSDYVVHHSEVPVVVYTDKSLQGANI